MMRSSFIAAALTVPLCVAHAAAPAGMSACLTLQNGGYAGYLLPTTEHDREEYGVVRLQFNKEAAEAVGISAVIFSNPRQTIKIERRGGDPERYPYRQSAQSWPEGGASRCRTSAARTLSCSDPDGDTISLRLTDDNAEIIGAATLSGAVCPLQWRIEN